MKLIEFLGDELEHCLNVKETMMWLKKLIMSKGIAKNRGRGCEYRGRAVIMAMEAEKTKTYKGGSKEEDC